MLQDLKSQHVTNAFHTNFTVTLYLDQDERLDRQSAKVFQHSVLIRDLTICIKAISEIY